MSGYLDAWRTGWGPKPGRAASLPAPLDARNGSELTGPQGTHPLAYHDAASLLRPFSGPVEGGFAIDGPARVGEGLAGRLELRATKGFEARKARLRLRGFLLYERERSESRQVNGSTHSEHWVEVTADELESIELVEAQLPLRLADGEAFTCPFTAPAPRLGPPSAHLGPAIVAWFLEASWDIALGGDARIANLVPIEQHPDLLRAGVIDLGETALLAEPDIDGATFAVTPPPPIAAGSTFVVRVAWPKAQGGRGGRVELHADLAGLGSARLAAVELPTASLAAGVEVPITLPSDLPPVLDAGRTRLRYRLRALVDLPLRPDLAVERGIAIGPARRDAR